MKTSIDSIFGINVESFKRLAVRENGYGDINGLYMEARKKKIEEIDSINMVELCFICINHNGIKISSIFVDPLKIESEKQHITISNTGTNVSFITNTQKANLMKYYEISDEDVWIKI